MARKKISEFRAKTLLYKELGLEYSGVEITPQSNIEEETEKLGLGKLYVVKVDEGVKKRAKQGWIKVKVQKSKVKSEIENLKNLGFEYFLVEEFIEHDQNEEKYLALARVREGLQVYFSKRGGVDIEEDREVKKFIVPYKKEDIEQFKTREFIQKFKQETGLEAEMLEILIRTFETNYCSFLELNPFLYLCNPTSPRSGQNGKSKIFILDAAIEVDSAAEFFVGSAWTRGDFREFSHKKKTPEEEAIDVLSENSQASFKLEVLNPNGSIFMLLSGGGASLVLADEVYNLGKGKILANYGEYSGNPNEEETYLYTKNILSLLLGSSADKKVLIIGGGVANFTDIRITFRGIIRALDEVKEKLLKQKVKVFVRRGGPFQEAGLSNMTKYLKQTNLYGFVVGPEIELTKIVNEAIGG